MADRGGGGRESQSSPQIPCLLGEGCYGVVELVTKDGKRQAVKMLYNSVLTKQTRESLTASLEEVRELHSDCPLLLPLLNMAVEADATASSLRVVLYMEFMPRSLRQALSEGLQEPWKTAILLDVANALHFLHKNASSCGHGDLHPDNVFIDTSTSEPCARLADYAQVQLTKRIPVWAMRKRGRCPRNVLCMPPEAFASPSPLIPVAESFDVFSLGVVTLEVFSTRPWEEVEMDGEGKLGEVEEGRDSEEEVRVEFQWPLKGWRKQAVMTAVPEMHPVRSEAMKCLNIKCGERPKLEKLIKVLKKFQGIQWKGGEKEEWCHLHSPSEEKVCQLPGPQKEEGGEMRGVGVEDEKMAENEEEVKKKGKRRNEEKQQKANEQSDRGTSDIDGGDHVTSSSRHVTSTSTLPNPATRPTSLFDYGSMVEVKGYGYGVVKWLGELKGKQIAGVELDQSKSGCGNGTPPGELKRYFSCPPGHGLFSPVANLALDSRFYSYSPVDPLSNIPVDDVPATDTEDGEDPPPPPPPPPPLYAPPADHYVSNTSTDYRGIQGEHNSCYVDATLFGLFALSSEFNDMLTTHVEGKIGKRIQAILRSSIVNPLRDRGVVRYKPVLDLRDELNKLGRIKGLRQEEKDPEEFLNVLLKHAFQLKPYFTIRRPQGEEGEFFVQLFLEPEVFDRQLGKQQRPLPTIGAMLSMMFSEQNILFKAPPNKLLVLVPRYGKQFKVFQRIIPDLVLDVSTLCADSAKQPDHGSTLGKDSGGGGGEGDGGGGGDREGGGGDREGGGGDGEGGGGEGDGGGGRTRQWLHSNLQLLSVICIETSHYVCFTRDRDKSKRWLFMDSMHDRVDDTYNTPKCVDCTAELNEWIYGSEVSSLKEGEREKKLKKTAAKNLPPLVRRFIQDIYMCVYVDDSTVVV